MNKVVKKTMEKEVLKSYNEILSHTSKESGLKSYSAIIETTDFSDGYVMDINIVIRIGEEMPFVDTVLFSPNGLVADCGAGEGSVFEGTYSLKSQAGDEYTVVIETEKAIEDAIALEYKHFFEGYNLPYALESLVALIQFRFTIDGLCDGMHIANLIAHINGMGNGCGLFDKEFTIKDVNKTVTALTNSYGRNIFRDDVSELTALLNCGKLDKNKALTGMRKRIKRLEAEKYCLRNLEKNI